MMVFEPQTEMESSLVPMEESPPKLLSSIVEDDDDDPPRNDDVVAVIAANDDDDDGNNKNDSGDNTNDDDTADTSAAAAATFKQFCATFNEIATATDDATKSQLLRNYLERLGKNFNDLRATFYLLFNMKTFNIRPRQMLLIMCKILPSAAQDKNELLKIDTREALQERIRSYANDDDDGASLSVVDVYRCFRALSQTSKSNQQWLHLAPILCKLTRDEIVTFFNLITHNNLPLLDTTLHATLNSLSNDAVRAYRVCGNVDLVLQKFCNGSLDDDNNLAQINSPIESQQVQEISTCTKLYHNLRNNAHVDYWPNTMRRYAVQVHYNNGAYEFYATNSKKQLDDVDQTATYAKLLSSTFDSNVTTSFILDLIILREAQHKPSLCVNFAQIDQSTQRIISKLKRERNLLLDIADPVNEVNSQAIAPRNDEIYIYDCLYLNGESMLRAPLRERLLAMSQHFGGSGNDDATPLRVKMSLFEPDLLSSPQKLQTFIKAKANWSVMLFRNLQAQYEPNERNICWFNGSATLIKISKRDKENNKFYDDDDDNDDVAAAAAISKRKRNNNNNNDNDDGAPKRRRTAAANNKSTWSLSEEALAKLGTTVNLAVLGVTKTRNVILGCWDEETNTYKTLNKITTKQINDDERTKQMLALYMERAIDVQNNEELREMFARHVTTQKSSDIKHTVYPMIVWRCMGDKFVKSAHSTANYTLRDITILTHNEEDLKYNTSLTADVAIANNSNSQIEHQCVLLQEIREIAASTRLR